MKANPSPMSVADYCNGLNSGEIEVNRDYQRSEGLWSAAARSFFIESILLEYPIPKLYLYAKLDLRSRKTVKEIVDGQQRSQALVAFFNNKLRLGRNLETVEVRGLKYSQLDGEWQTRFLSYSLPIDQFSGVPEDEVREAFRRMNANNVPLNDEEQRNARYQGDFKWFVIELAEKYKDVLFNIGLFTKRDLIRMADLRFYSEIASALDEGFRTIKGKQIDDLYKKYNASFPNKEKFEEMIVYGIESSMNFDAVLRPTFLRPHVFQSIILALISRRWESAILIAADSEYTTVANDIQIQDVSMEKLAQSLEDPDAFPALARFYAACTSKTNVEESKVIRYLYFLKALS